MGGCKRKLLESSSRSCGNGCGFKGTVKQVEVHERDCDRRQYVCACGFTGTKEEVKEHARTCDQALAVCACGFTGSGADVVAHSLKCTDAVFECEHDCGYKGTRRQVEQHEEICSDNPLLCGAASSRGAADEAGTAVKKKAVRGLLKEMEGLNYRDPFMGKRNTLAPDAPPARSVIGYQVRDSAVPVAVTQVSRESGSDSVDQKAEGGSASAECGKTAMDATDTVQHSLANSGNGRNPDYLAKAAHKSNKVPRSRLVTLAHGEPVQGDGDEDFFNMEILAWSEEARSPSSNMEIA